MLRCLPLVGLLILAACASPSRSGAPTDATSEDTASPQPDGAALPSEDAASPPEDSAADDEVSEPPVEDTHTPPSPSEVTLFIGDWTMVPGQETTRCVLKRLPDDGPLTIKAIRTKLAPGSHHLIVYRSSAKTEQPEPKPCQPFTDTIAGGAPLMITEIPEEELRFPEGVGLTLPAGQMIRLEAHYLNYYPEEITAHADVTFELAEPGEVQETADFLFYGTGQFSLPPNSTAQTDWTYMDVPNGAKIFGLTGHTHRMGTLVEVEQSTAGAPGTPIYPLDEPFKWDEAPILTYDPPLEFPSKQGLRFRCHWNNTSNEPIGFGQSAKSEMCFLWAYYYPSQGFRLCAKGLPFGSCGDDG